MGIRFRCEHCEKRIHVKDFLGGRKARCPHCNQVIVIPRQSTASVDASRSTLVTASNSGVGQEAEPKPAAEQTSKPDAKSQTPVAKTQKTAANTPAEETKATDHAEEFADVPTRGPNPSANQSQATAVTQQTPQTDSTGTQSATPEQEAPGQAGQAAQAEHGAGAAVQTGPAAISAPELPGTPNPFSEVPGAMWYVATAAGGQYGPADAQMLQSWIAEGRVGRDAMVWREGWEQWQSATVVIPADVKSPHSPNAPASSASGLNTTASTGEATASSASESAIENRGDEGKVSSHPVRTDGPASLRYQQRRRHSKNLGIALIVGLAFLSVLLIAGLIYVLVKSQ